jgi:PKD repeat protein
MPATVLVNTSSGIGTPQIYTHTIKVGIANSNFLLGNAFGIGQNAWERALNYSWIVDNQKYVFTMEEFNITLYQYPDALAQFNVIAYAGPHDELDAFGHDIPNYEITDPNGATYILNINEMKQNLRDYISNGGGLVGHCVGATLPIELSHEPTTSMEKNYWNDHFLYPTKCNVSSDTHIGLPILDEYRFLIPKDIKRPPKIDNPELICQGVFTWYAGCNSSNSSKGGGVPLDVIVTDHNHPIFKDYLNNTWRVQFGGGAGLIIPAGADVSRLSSFPSTLDDNSSYVAWRWPIINPPYRREDLKLLSKLVLYYLCDIPFAPDAMEFLINTTGWRQHEILGEPQYMDFRVTDMPMTVAFNYPEGDINSGRLVLCTCHPELSIWNTTGNYVAHNNNSPENNLWDGLEVWRNQTTERLLNESDRIYNTTNWFMRREVAWAAGNLLGEQTRVPDTYLPPVYGNTQVVDITPQLQEHPEFIIKCCFGHNNDETFSPMNLSLFYRYKGANSSYTWRNWTRYASIHTAPYRFTFNATLANGTGRYEFCSILNATRLYYGTQSYYNESFPPAADASCYVGGDIVSDFRFEPGTPYVNETVHFYGEAITKENTYIVTYLWDFGDTRGPGPGPENTTHKFTHPGVYTVNLTVVNNQSKRDTALINITVLNNPPIADFTPSFIIVHVNDPVDFNDTSTDPDGYLVNWSWDFGDNTTAYTQNATHSYNTSDFYTVSLRVTDNENATDTETKPNCVLAVNAFVNGSLPADIPQQHKWKTIQKAIDNSSTCDFIYVLNGNYTENITVNKSVVLIGQDENNVIINGSVIMINPFDYELPAPDDEYSIPVISMNGTELLMHFNNDTAVGENYTSSNVVYDYSGQKNNGTRHGAKWTTSTLKGAGCFDFDGNDDSINLTSIPALSGVNVTISAWVYWMGGSGVLDPIVSQVNKSGCGYRLSVNAITRKPFFQLNETMVISSQALSPGWHNIVGTHNETKLKIYVDGVFKGAANIAGHGVAADGFIGFDNASDHFDGRIDEVTIWNRTLSGNEISLDCSVDEIFSLYNENYGVYMEGFTICDASVVGMIPGNHTEVSRCVLLDNPTGIFIHDVNDVWINQCNITGGTIGINVNSSYPEEYNAIRLVDCDVKNITHAIYVNSSANISVIRTIVNGSVTNLTFNDCDFTSMTIFCTTSVYDVAPDVPSISGPENGDRGKTYTYSACTNDSNDDQLLYLFDWDDGNNSGWLGPYWSNDRVNASHAWSNEGGYYVKVKAKDIFNNESTWNSILFRTEMLPPIITSVQHSPDVAGFGATISIQANVTDNQTGNWSGIRTVHVNITLPDHTTENYTMTYVGDDIYQYNFSDTWLTGQYNFTIWAQDNAYNGISSSGYHFHISADATISIATLKNSYSGSQYINITDPPNPPENYTLVGRGLTWNTYYNASTGENILEAYQGPVNYQEDNSTWTPINTSLHQLTTNHPAYNYGYRIGNDRGLFGVYFKPNAQNDWPVAFTYNRSDDPTTHAIRSKLVGVGYVDPESNWDYHYLQNVQSSQGQFTDNTATYEGVFTGTDVTWSYGNTELKEEITLSNETKTTLQNHPPSLYGLNNESSYLVFITKLDHQNLDMYNASGMLTGNVTISDAGVEFKDALGYFKCALPLGEAYELNNESVRQKLTYRIVHLNGNTYLLSGLKVSDLNAMTFPVVIDPTLTVYSTSSDGYIYNSGTNYNTVQSASTGKVVNSSATYITIGQRRQPENLSFTYYIYRGFVFFNTSALPSNAYLDNATLSLYKKDDYSSTDFTITIQNGQPTFPHNPLQTGDYGKSHYSGNGGGLNTSRFVNGRNNITLTNLNWINKTGTTKLCLRSSRDINGTTPTGSEYVNVYSANAMDPNPDVSYKPKLIISYRNQSKIKNTGSTNIKGYLLIQVQFYNTSQSKWLVDNDTVNETTSRTINSGSQLALDTIFNGRIRASDLTHGTGTYRVYAALRDPEGNILKTNTGSELKAWWQFSKT